MNLAAKAVVAAVPATAPAKSPNGPVLGPNAANAISDALADAGYVVIKRSEIDQLRSGMERVLGMLPAKK